MDEVVEEVLPRLPPVLVDELVEEVLLRLPPDEPTWFVRSSAVCKPWRRILAAPRFRRRYCEFHGTPPLLGYFRGHGNFVPTSALVPAQPDRPDMISLDCRHGRVLIHMLPGFLVWDPVTGDKHHLPPEPEEIDWLIYSAVLLCAADGCDHLDCRGGPFRVVFTATHEDKDIILASVYSSDTGEWSSPVCLDNTCEIYARHIREARADGPMGRFYTPYVQPRRGALVGDAVYFTVRRGNAIVKYDLGKDRLSMIDPPQHCLAHGIAITAVENYTSLGFTCIQGSTLHTWARKVDTEETAEWVQYRVIELEKPIPVSVANRSDKPFVVGFAEGVGVIFVSSGVGLFTIKLSSGLVKKVDEPGEYFSVLPYMSFYLPSNGGGHDATDLPHNT